MKAWLARWWPALAGAALLGARVVRFGNPYFVVDDAFISFRYAANLAHGLGLVYNPGERVEGYSNFLWTVLIAGGLRLGLEPVRLSIALSLAAAIFSIVLLLLWARRLFAPRAALSAAGHRVAPLLCALPPLLFAATGSQARYVVSGMETLLFGALVLAAVYCLAVADRPRLAGAAFALAAATRPEGAMYWALALALTLWPGTEPDPPDAIGSGRLGAGGGTAAGRLAAGRLAAGSLAAAGWRQALRPRLRRAAGLAAVFLLLFLPYFIWRWSYYGYPLPNTYYAKAGGFAWSRVGRGAALLAEVCGKWRVYPLAAAALAALPAVRRSRALTLCLAFVAATVAYFLYVGGDFLFFFGPRFLMPVLPMLLLLAAAGVGAAAAAAGRIAGRIAGRWRRHAGEGSPSPAAGQAVALAAGVLLLANALWLSWPADGAILTTAIATESEAWEHLGRWIAANTPPHAVLATGTAGIVPYYSRRFTIDMYGLADEHIAHRQPLAIGFKQVAHERYDPQYVLDRKPDLLISYCDRQGVPRQGGLPRLTRRVRACYRPLLLIKDDGTVPADGRWLLASRVLTTELWDAGYHTVLFERRQGRGRARCEAIEGEPAATAGPPPAAAQ